MTSFVSQTTNHIGQGDGTGPGGGEFVRMAVMRTIGTNHIVHGFVIENSLHKTFISGNRGEGEITQRHKKVGDGDRKEVVFYFTQWMTVGP
jgi:hypothetical protein